MVVQDFLCYVSVSCTASSSGRFFTNSVQEMDSSPSLLLMSFHHQKRGRVPVRLLQPHRLAPLRRRSRYLVPGSAVPRVLHTLSPDLPLHQSADGGEGACQHAFCGDSARAPAGANGFLTVRALQALCPSEGSTGRSPRRPGRQLRSDERRDDRPTRFQFCELSDISPHLPTVRGFPHSRAHAASRKPTRMGKSWGRSRAHLMSCAHTLPIGFIGLNFNLACWKPTWESNARSPTPICLTSLSVLAQWGWRMIVILPRA